MERDSLLMYRGTWGMLQDIRANNMDEYIEAVDMFFNYAFDGVEPDIDGASLVLRLFWKAAKPLIDANNRNYVNGCKGGAPSESMKGNQNARKNKQTENKPKTNPKQTTGKTENKPKQTQNKGNDNDNVNEEKIINYFKQHYPTLTVKTTRGIHFYYSIPAGVTIKNGADKITVGGFQVDFKTGTKSYAIVKHKGKMREANRELSLKNLPALPIEMYPLAKAKNISGLAEGDGRNNALFYQIKQFLLRLLFV